jgi:hypothetical protein
MRDFWDDEDFLSCSPISRGSREGGAIVSAAFDILEERMEAAPILKRLLEALNPEAAAPLDTPFADAWRKLREADLASESNIEQGGERYPPEIRAGD